ncbi:rod shape-determining protein MreD [Caloramator mitchellensis]|uniref:Rod shape-determining protein MreD n=1 Tax=Caloramator mitchellensis TaxID=908809 RepID=A0A0R3K6T2_CALMK|nr:rod shape-determining protein MreD [Caloramator mitchellensis]KRQ88143.1 rod shape-determining protein MreD [Caloramator mitchellensis]
MKKYIVFMLTALFLLSLQEAFFSRLSFYNIYFDIPMILIICIAMTLEDTEAFFIILFAGIVRDSMFPGIFGVNSIFYLLLFYLITRIQNKIYKEKVSIFILIIIFSTLLKYVVYFVSFYIASIKFNFIEMIKSTLLIEVIGNIILSRFINNWIKRIYNSSFVQKDWKN